MKYVEMKDHDVFRNLATEEYILNHFTDDSYLLLYINDTSIVLGKYQNIYQEINVPVAESSGIKVARRISGGGTVFHDSGNLNYSFVTFGEKGKAPCYDDFLNPVIEALGRMGIPAHKRNICDLAIDGKKISGSAQTVHGNRILHHGTLLFSSDLSSLKRLLTATDAAIESKAVASVPSEVANIRDSLNLNMTVEEFRDSLLCQLFPEGISRRDLTDRELLEIEELRGKKYTSWDWNWGKSPKFRLQKEDSRLTVNHGIITECQTPLLSSEAADALIGARYGYQNLMELLFPYCGEKTERLVNALF